MKTLLLMTTLLLTVPSYASSEDSAQTIIRSYGYVCDRVDAIQRFLIGEGFHVYCNNFRYHFEIHNKGGKIFVIAK